MRLMTSTSDEVIAYVLLRAVAGVNLLMHGAGRLLAGKDAFSAHLAEQFARSPLPQTFVHAFGTVLPAVEGLIGLLLLMGLNALDANCSVVVDDSTDVRVGAGAGLVGRRDAADVRAGVFRAVVFPTV